MGEKSTCDFITPLRGYYKGSSYADQPPGTCPDALNVVARSPRQGRAIIASREGMSKAFEETLGSGAPIRLMATCDVVRSDGRTRWQDTFSGAARSATWENDALYWTGSEWAIDTVDGLAYYDQADGSGTLGCTVDGAALSPAMDTTKDYVIAIEIIPKNNRYGGEANGSTCVFTVLGNGGSYDGDGQFFKVNVTFSTTQGTATYTSALAVNRFDGANTVTDPYTWASGTTSVVKPLILRVLYTASTGTVSATLDGTSLGSQVITAPTGPAAFGTDVGFGMSKPDQFVNSFLFEYYNSGTGTEDRPRKLPLASAGGTLYRETWQGSMSAVSGSLTLISDRFVQAVDRQGVLYIADHGKLYAGASNGTTNAGGTTLDSATYTDWTTLGLNANDFTVYISSSGGGTAVTAGMYAVTAVAAGNLTISPSCGGDGTTTGIVFRVERSPKLYTDSTGAMTRWTATTGMVPLGNTLIARYRDRIVLSGARNAPYAFYMSRSGDPDDWDYAAASTDELRAVAGGTGDVGGMSQPISCMFAFLNDYMIFASPSSMHILRGDPASGGQMDVLDAEIGIPYSRGYCIDHHGGAYFLSRNGLGYLPPSSTGPSAVGSPILLSDGDDARPIPTELKEIDATVTEVSMAYDVQQNRVMVCLFDNTARSSKHWLFDVGTRSFWPMSTAATNDISYAMSYSADFGPRSGVLLGCRDGRIRRLHRWAGTDDGSTILSHVRYAPIQFGPNSWTDGMLVSMKAMVPSWSSPVTWRLFKGDMAEVPVLLTSAGTDFQGTFNVQDLGTKNVRMRGQSVVLHLSYTDVRQWGVERVSGVVESLREARKG